MLLQFEATREEPKLIEPGLTEVINQLSTPQLFVSPETIVDATELETTQADEITSEPIIQPDIIDTTIVDTTAESLDPTMLNQLEQFADNIQQTTERLHQQVVNDAAPYAPTTSRLEEMAKSTRELVERISGRQTSPQEVIGFSVTIEPTETSVSEPAGTIAIDAQAANIAINDLNEIRVGIIDDSLFFTHLIELVLQSNGFQSQRMTSHDFSTAHISSLAIDALIVGSPISSNFAQAIEAAQSLSGMTVIRVTESGAEHTDINADATVARSKLIDIGLVLTNIFTKSLQQNVA
jgi:6-pyruvoyl-tetrahydropterin synthase